MAAQQLLRPPQCAFLSQKKKKKNLLQALLQAQPSDALETLPLCSLFRLRVF
eukprot:CAMPEP_0206214738 /NCGR_PEP_ID=MMETSP0047_2-20121206/1826_1 /ASSEMBLY_ACC=CAM_ASM_000192 /TAXON_ID=195065 /ORGANISM="Chroomonas mesostigmatica_cf, Strain CCMP1168" /LENGTH=51 /DNA_ID=CAMNT_0053636995 /DNA_START=42 /DNA_END=197 /DNA_ORIENTATION=+